MRLAALLFSLSFACASVRATPGPDAVQAAAHARAAYSDALVDSLAGMVSFNTVADPKVAFENNPQHQGFKRYLKDLAGTLGLDVADHGYVLIIGLGQGSERVGIITHGDIQPVDPAKWKQSPFLLDRTSEPGRLVGRGTEDDKGPIATAMYAMKAIKDSAPALSKRLELYVYMAEESDWEPLSAFLKTHVPPQVNITIDAEYPVVTAEKGWGMVRVTMPHGAVTRAGKPAISSFSGGFFGSQIPEDARAVVANATPALEARIRARAAAQKGMQYALQRQGSTLSIEARGVSAHSSKPEDGVNAVSMLADALRVARWPDNQAGMLVNLLNDLVGTGLYGERFGKIAYADPFMGPMTFSPTVIKQTAQGLELGMNLRRPRGKAGPVLEAEIRAALEQWQGRHGKLAQIGIELNEPWVQAGAPQIPTLLSVFSHYTGIADPKPVSIGGGTNARLFPNAVSFGPAMPGAVYTGHSEHEFITVKQLLLNLEMYTAVMVELAR